MFKTYCTQQQNTLYNYIKYQVWDESLNSDENIMIDFFHVYTLSLSNIVKFNKQAEMTLRIA